MTNWHELFKYDDGILYWKIKPSNNVNIGDVAGNRFGIGYVRVMYKHRHYLCHCIIWEMHNGPIPEGYEIDHIDHIPYHNQIENLRLVTHKENMRNASLSSRNKSGRTGVYWYKPNQKWLAYIRVDGKYHHLGYFEDFNDAVKAREDAEQKYKFHSEHGKRNERIQYDPTLPPVM